MKSKIAVGLFLFSTPIFAAASVSVTEVMYDLPGSDAGREWVEITNDGPELDLKEYKFFNKDGGHLLKAYGSGTTVLPPGAVAVLADKPDLFLIDWPQYAGILIDSSFSLVTADTVGIKDPDGAIIASVSYSSDLGAKGDGNSLQYTGSAATAASPTPGTTGASLGATQQQASTASDTGSSTTSSSSQTSSASVQKPEVPIKRITVDAGGDRTVVVGAAAVFTAKVFGTAGEPIQNPRLTWNFGNGDLREGQTVQYTYEYPGVYNLMVMGASGEYSSSDRVLIEALPATLALSVETGGTIRVFNKEKRDLDVSLWLLVRGGGTFLIPKDTVILGGKSVAFSPQSTKLPSSGETTLQYPNGINAIAAQEAVPQTGALQAAAAVVSAAIFSKPKQETVAAAYVAPVSPQDTQGEVDEAGPAQQAGDTKWLLWLSGALGLGVLGAASVLFMRSQGASGDSGSTVSKIADTYEIIE